MQINRRLLTTLYESDSPPEIADVNISACILLYICTSKESTDITSTAGAEINRGNKDAIKVTHIITMSKMENGKKQTYIKSHIERYLRRDNIR